MRALRLLAAAALLALGVLAVALLARRTPPGPPASPPGAPAEPTPAPVTITLFFPGDDLLLHRERRSLPALPSATARCAEAVLQELLAGSQGGWASPFSWPATVDAVFALPDGTVVADVSPPPAGHIQGSASEVALAYSAVNSIVASCSGVARVHLLFGGRQVETLGHVDLSRPLAPRPDLVAP